MIVNDLKRDVNRQLWGDGTGAIAACEGTTNSVTVNLATTASDVQFRQLQIGMSVDIGTTAAPTGRTSANIITATGGSAGSYTITLTTATTTSVTDYVFRTGNGGVVGTNQKEITGVQLIVDSSGTVFNVNPTTYPVWKSVETGNSGTNRAISENLMANVVHDVQIAGGSYPNLAVCHHGVQRAYAAHLMSIKRFTNTVDLDGGYGKGLSFIAGGGPEIPVTVDRDCPANSMYFFNTSHLTEFQMSDWEFMEEDGSVLHWLGTVDQYNFVLYKYHEFATDKRNAHGKLVDITHA
jgi:hypothetical protein